MYSGRRYSNSKKGFPFALFGIFLITTLFIVINRIILHSANNIALYLISVNLTTILIFGLDKILASLQKERVPEKVLYAFCVFGGTFGGFIAMYFFRHKTQKTSFQATIGGILFLQLLLLVLVYNIT